MKINSSEISALIKKQIEDFSTKVESNDVGTVITVGDGVALVYGLDKAMLGELVEFPHGIYGMVMNLEEENVGCVLLGSDTEIKEGDLVKRTKRVVEVPVGNNLLGRVVNALGQPLDGLGDIKASKTRPVERIAPGVMYRKSVDTPLQTGIKAIVSPHLRLITWKPRENQVQKCMGVCTCSWGLFPLAEPTSFILQHRIIFFPRMKG